MPETLVPAAGGAAPAAASPAPDAPALSPIAQAAADARALVEANKAAAAAPAPAGGAPTADPAAPAAPPAPAAPAIESEADFEARIADLDPVEQEIQRTLRTEDLAAADAPKPGAAPAPVAGELVVELPPRNDGEAAFRIEVGDKESADRLRQLIRGYARGEQAREMRDHAQAMIDETNLRRYEVQLDPVGALLRDLTDPTTKRVNLADAGHLLRFLATRPGMIDAHGEWLAGLVQAPDSVAGEAAMIEAERIKRRDDVRGKIDSQRAVDANAAQLVRTAHKTIETMAPASYSDDAKAQLYKDVLTDLREFARAKNLQTVDPRAIPGLVMRRFKLLGVTPRSSQPASTVADKGGPAPAAAASAAASSEPTAEQLLKARQARAAGASAPPGAGSPVATVPKAPKFDPSKPGNPIQQAAAHAREYFRTLRGKPA